MPSGQRAKGAGLEGKEAGPAAKKAGVAGTESRACDSGSGLDRETVIAIEKALQKLPGVGSVRLLVNEAGEIQEVHALADSGRLPKQVVKDFETLLLTKFGIEIDHRKISIAQLGDEPKPPGPLPRLVIRGLELRNQGTVTSVRVELADPERSTAGAAEGPSSTTNKLRLVAQATLAAVKGFTGDLVQYVLEDVRLERVARREVVVVCVTLVGAKGEETLLGTCRVGRDETEATIRATLSALNRRLGKLIPQAKPA
ncbi:MAG: hypothetical protein QME79_02995 [Bacillota bacterium]|nr:hypothetical protein [Bacillota bacterium]